MKRVLLMFFYVLTIISVSAQQFTSITPSGHTLYYAVSNIAAHEVKIFCPYGGGCYDLSGSLIIPDSVAYQGTNYAVTEIDDASVSYGYYTYYHGLFENNASLTSITLPNTMRKIGSYAFFACENLVIVNMNPGLQIISSYAFKNCNNITSITIPSSVTLVGAEVFSGCTSLSNLTLNANAAISSNEFKGCTSLTNITIPNGVTSIGDSAFYACINLTQISIPNSVTHIGREAFNSCQQLQNLVLPDSLQFVPIGMCLGCFKLKNVTIPNSIAYIKRNAFGACGRLLNVIVPNTVISIENDAFSNVCNVVYHGTATGAPWGAYCVNGYIHDSIVYSDSTLTTLLRAHQDISCANILSSVTSIGDGAFYGCINIPNLTIGDNVSSIGSEAFYWCSNLSNVTLGNNVTAISDRMFYGCSSLSVSPLNNNIQTIGQQSFQNTNISSVSIPQTCTSIGDQAFSGSPISTVDAQPVVPPSIGSNVFSSSPTITVPCGLANSYQSAWYQYQNLITEPIVDFELTVLASEGGQAQATSDINCMDSTATINATNGYGYHFDHWSDGNTDNPRIIHVTSDTTVTAIFARNIYTVTLNTSNETIGSTNGGGTYLYGDTATLYALAHHQLLWI